MEYALGQDQLDKIEQILLTDLIASGVHCVLLIDFAGNIIAQGDNGRSRIDVYSLAALSAANFGAVEAMAKIVGQEEFALLFHKGETGSLYFSKVNDELLIISVFGKEIVLGLLRMKVADAILKIQQIWKSS
ncbi:MAG: roadblock/LC7 domain-containing protein [Deltaproteobacteria bacterium]|nr:roadblock/LC7 domain-containing protein [Deltaproteobacteria bacterium]